MGEVAVWMTAVVEFLQHGRDAMPLDSPVPFLQQDSRELQHRNMNKWIQGRKKKERALKKAVGFPYLQLLGEDNNNDKEIIWKASSVEFKCIVLCLFDCFPLLCWQPFS